MVKNNAPVLRPVCPCVKDCEKRHSGCAVNCEAWKAYAAERDRFYKRQTEVAARDYETEATLRAYRRADRRKRRTKGFRFMRNR